MTGRKNPRREVLPKLRGLKDFVQSMVRVWSHVPSVRYFPDEPGAPSRWHSVPRKRSDVPASEYVENDPEQWASLAGYMHATCERAARIERFALAQVGILGAHCCSWHPYRVAVISGLLRGQTVHRCQECYGEWRMDQPE